MAHPHHLLNTSWTLHRLSPLHHGNNNEPFLCNQRALEIYATRLRDHLTNSLADAQGWREEDGSALSNIGALKSCTWETISTLSFLNPHQEGLDGDPQQPAGILVTLAYDTITYKAALLTTTPSSATQNQKKRRRNNSSSSTYLPLLLTRLPKALRESFITFLSANFDTYVSPLRLPSTFICDVLERYVRSLPMSSTGAGAGTTSTSLTEDILREMHLTLSFAPPISPALKTLNVSIPRETFTAFLLRISPASLSTISSSSAEQIGEKGENEGGGGGGGSVLSGLEVYLRDHLALELGLNLPSSGERGLSSGSASLAGGYVRLTRVACAGFVVTGEGKMKIVAKASDLGSESGNGGEEDERNMGALRGGEVLLRAVLERAVTGE